MLLLFLSTTCSRPVRYKFGQKSVEIELSDENAWGDTCRLLTPICKDFEMHTWLCTVLEGAGGGGKS
jgi:hypothetical protein